MGFDAALRLTEIAMCLAFLQQSAEHIALRDAPALYLLRCLLCVLVISGIGAGDGGTGGGPLATLALLGLVGIALAMLRRYNGPFNGGSDRMSILVLCCVTCARITPFLAPQELVTPLQELALGYLAAQLILSYVISGLVKIVTVEWRSGRALCDVFAFSAYPVSMSLRGWAARPRLLWLAGWAVMLFEIAFPLALLHPAALIAALTLAAAFHLSNALTFGLNRFFWIWLSAYPALIWLQSRAFGA